MTVSEVPLHTVWDVEQDIIAIDLPCIRQRD